MTKAVTKAVTAPTALLVNGQALALTRDPGLLERLRRRLEPGDLVAVTDGPDQVPAQIRRFATRGSDPLFICGGDGTILSVLTAVIESYDRASLPAIGLLRGGTINTLAKYLKIGGAPDELLARLLPARLDRARRRRLAVIRVNERYGLTFGAALMGRFYHEYNQLPSINRLTVTRYVARVVLSAVFGTARARRLLRPVPATIEADGARLPIDAFTVIVASCMEDHGFGVKPTYRGSSAPGRFQLLASAKGREGIVGNYHRLLLGRPIAGDDHYDGMVRAARIVFEQPELCMVDGEVFEARKIELEIGPELEFLLPR